MGDVGDYWRDVDAHRKALRERLGVPCPICVQRLPKANPKILLPTQLCRMHNYRDPRPKDPEQ
jgi:hypothetical protein